MTYASIESSPTAEDLLLRARELEQLASLVSYGADKARLQERARRLRQQAGALPAENRSWSEAAGLPKR